MFTRYYTVVTILCCASLQQIQGHGAYHHASSYVSPETKQKMSELHAAKPVMLLREACNESGNELHLVSLPELREILHRAEHDILHMFEQILGEGSYRIEIATDEDTKEAMRYLLLLSQDEKLLRALIHAQGRFVTVPRGRTVSQHLRLLLLGALIDLLENTERGDDHMQCFEREDEYADQE